jgi:hypothetical protein
MKKILLFAFISLPFLGFSQTDENRPSIKLTQPPFGNKPVTYMYEGAPVPFDDKTLPLLVIDGLLLSFEKKTEFEAKLNAINPNTIASMDVLKGQKAIDIFGEKGNNGAIIITSKK